jgi:hypothetical protein
LRFWESPVLPLVHASNVNIGGPAANQVELLPWQRAGKIAHTLFRCGLGFDPTAESGLPQTITFTGQRSTVGKLRTASFAQHSLSLFRAGVSHGLVFAMESTPYFGEFRNLD